MAVISGVSTSGFYTAPATLNGTGFGASQGASVLLFYPAAGQVIEVSVTSWTNTVIQTSIPPEADVGSGYFVVVVGGTPSLRSPTVPIRGVSGAGDASIRSGTTVILAPNTEGTPYAP